LIPEKRTRFVSEVVALTIVGLLIAAPGVVAKERAERLLSSVELTLAEQLTAPPSEGSPEQSADMERVLNEQSLRTPQQSKEAEADAERTLKRFLDGTSDARLAEIPSVRKVIADGMEEIRAVIDDVKDRWPRKRPFQTSGDVKPCELNRPKSNSYPSGHAALGSLLGTVFAEIVPAHREVLEKRGIAYGWSRVVCGFHYPSDVEAGRRIGIIVAEMLLSKPAFAERIRIARKDVRRTLGD
jgi:acid phosphatase (class A)